MSQNITYSKQATKPVLFSKNKYGKELLLDIGKIQELENYILDDTPHHLSFYEILFIEAGQGSFSLDDHEMPLAPQTVMFCSPGQMRQWQLERPVRGYTIFFEKDFLNLFFSDPVFLYRFHFFHQYREDPKVILSTEDFHYCMGILYQVHDEIRNLQNDSNHLLRALLYQLLIFLNRAYARTHELKSDTAIHPLFYRFRLYLEQEFDPGNRVVDYAALLKTSPSQLNKVCRQCSGLSAQQLIHNKLISLIKRSLQFTQEPVGSIAYRYQFSDPSNFNRFFRQAAGVNPLQYRKQFQ